VGIEEIMLKTRYNIREAACSVDINIHDVILSFDHSILVTTFLHSVLQFLLHCNMEVVTAVLLYSSQY
jgi:hypothetical protein